MWIEKRKIRMILLPWFILCIALVLSACGNTEKELDTPSDMEETSQIEQDSQGGENGAENTGADGIESENEAMPGEAETTEQTDGQVEGNEQTSDKPKASDNGQTANDGQTADNGQAAGNG